jgi:hypothetical protein
MVRAGAGFHANQAGGCVCHQRQELVACDLRFDQYRLAGFINTVYGKYVLGKIDSDWGLSEFLCKRGFIYI